MHIRLSASGFDKRLPTHVSQSSVLERRTVVDRWLRITLSRLVELLSVEFRRIARLQWNARFERSRQGLDRSDAHSAANSPTQPYVSTQSVKELESDFAQLCSAYAAPAPRRVDVLRTKVN